MWKSPCLILGAKRHRIIITPLLNNGFVQIQEWKSQFQACRGEVYQEKIITPLLKMDLSGFTME